MKQKPKREEKTIKGEVEGYSREITPFPGGRGSRGMKVEGDWHNMIGSKDFLGLLEDSFAPGSFVVFAEKKNKKGYWDFIEGTLKKITKEEAYSEEIQDEIQTEAIRGKRNPDYKSQQGKVEEEQVRDLTPADIDLLKEEILQMESRVLEKKHQLTKLSYNEQHISKSLKYAIEQERNIILAAEGRIEDFEFDYENNVTLAAIQAKKREAKKEISRLEKNIKVRNAEIVNDSPDRNEKARINIHGPI